MALLLFIDTCADEGFIGLAEDDVWLDQKTLSDARRFGEILHLEADLLFRNAGKSWSELDAVAVVSGPGSYTGLRVGMAAAKGWCFALDIPLITLNRLELLLQQWRAENPVSGKVAVLLPARAGEWFGIIGEEEGKIFLSARHFTDKAFAEIVGKENVEHIVLAGNGNQLMESGKNISWMTEQIDRKIFCITLFQYFHAKTFTNLWEAKPEYLKEVYIAS